MGLKEAISRMIEKKREKKLRFKEMEDEYRMEKMLEEKQKSSNERELERFLKEKRELVIKNNLEKFRKQKQKETWNGNQILKGKIVSEGKPSILKNDKPILNTKNIIMDIKNPKSQINRSMFWK